MQPKNSPCGVAGKLSAGFPVWLQCFSMDRVIPKSLGSSLAFFVTILVAEFQDFTTKKLPKSLEFENRAINIS